MLDWGGNRKLWTNVEVTAVENDPTVAKFYQEQYPDDTVIVGDAHQYVLENYHKFGFIWLSPPCPTHSRARYWASKGARYAVEYPDASLYQEITLLRHFHSGLWAVENVKPYYDPWIKANACLSRHLFWSNFSIAHKVFPGLDVKGGKRSEWQEALGINIDGYRFNQRTDKLLRNCVQPALGLHVMNECRAALQTNNLVCA